MTSFLPLTRTEPRTQSPLCSWSFIVRAPHAGQILLLHVGSSWVCMKTFSEKRHVHRKLKNTQTKSGESVKLSGFTSRPDGGRRWPPSRVLSPSVTEWVMRGRPGVEKWPDSGSAAIGLIHNTSCSSTSERRFGCRSGSDAPAAARTAGRMRRRKVWAGSDGSNGSASCWNDLWSVCSWNISAFASLRPRTGTGNHLPTSNTPQITAPAATCPQTFWMIYCQKNHEEWNDDLKLFLTNDSSEIEVF